MFRVLGYCCFAFAVVDLGTYYFGIADLTGVGWSPIAAAVTGSVLSRIGDHREQEPPAGNESAKTASTREAPRRFGPL